MIGGGASVIVFSGGGHQAHLIYLYILPNLVMIGEKRLGDSIPDATFSNFLLMFLIDLITVLNDSNGTINPKIDCELRASAKQFSAVIRLIWKPTKCWGWENYS